MNKIQCVIYDLDDTLYDFIDLHPLATEALADRARDMLGADREEFLRIYGRSYEDLGHVLGEDKIVGTCHSRTLRLTYTLERMGLPLFPAVQELYHVYWDYILDRMEPMPYIKEVMETLKEKGIRVGIGTNMTAMMQYKKLSRLGLGKYIDFMVTSEESVFDKPDRAFFDLVLAKAGCPGENCLFIGDNLELDALGSREAGLLGLWYDPEEKWTAASPLAEEHVIRDHREILFRL
ncbi:MAG: HAD family hydrolase [Lachnospiraceae bacterium]|nr:HAD family hydrolase [Lachnospiraceae bacterium]